MNIKYKLNIKNSVDLSYKLYKAFYSKQIGSLYNFMIILFVGLLLFLIVGPGRYQTKIITLVTSSLFMIYTFDLSHNSGHNIYAA